MFAVVEAEMGVFIQTEILVQKNSLHFRWNTIDFSVAHCFSNKSIAEMQPRQGRHISVGFQGLRKYFPSHWCLFPCSHGDGY